MAANPMTQFEVYRIGPEIKIGNFDISFIDKIGKNSINNLSSQISGHGSSYPSDRTSQCRFESRGGSVLANHSQA